MLDRKNSPDFQSIKPLNIIEPIASEYSNGLKRFTFSSEDLELVKLEFVFKNVNLSDKLPLLNVALSAMLKEGTNTRSSAQIANEIDFYGAYLMPEYSYDHSSLTLYTMRKYAVNLLPIVYDILNHSIFPEKELETYILNNKQNLLISLKKNDVLARRMFYQNVFGEHRYGTVLTQESYDAITREDIIELYNAQISPSNCTLFVSGNIDASIDAMINDIFGDKWLSNSRIEIQNNVEIISSLNLNLIYEEKNDAIQSALRLGALTIKRDHPDYPALQFVNTIFGGFFGSRLMRNIREDKGFTYSIGSSVVSLLDSGFLTIATEVGVDVTNDALSEILKEIDILRTEKTSDDEIALVRNYMQGVLLGSLESIFSHADKFKSVYFTGLDLSYYKYYSDVISTINSEKVLDIAQKYFDYNHFVKVVVGKMQS